MSKLRFETPSAGQIWNRLRTVRNFCRYTQQELSRRTGVSMGTLSNLETGGDYKVSDDIKQKVYKELKKALKNVDLELEYVDLFPAHYMGDSPHPLYEGRQPVKLRAFKEKQE